jgi:hypothetical protein
MPRLERVVAGKDPGGITSTETREPANDLPDGATTADAAAATRILSLLTPESEELEKVSPEALAAITDVVRRFAKTRKVVTKNWNGGGGFRVLDVGPTMFDEVDGQVFLAGWAAGDRLAEAVAAQYNFEFEIDSPFAGRRGKQRLAVIDGLVNDPVINFLLDWLPEDELLVVFGTGVDPYTQDRLAELHRGSTLQKIPEAILSSYRQVNRRTSGLNWTASIGLTEGA